MGGLAVPSCPHPLSIKDDGCLGHASCITHQVDMCRLAWSPRVSCAQLVFPYKDGQAFEQRVVGTSSKPAPSCSSWLARFCLRSYAVSTVSAGRIVGTDAATCCATEIMLCDVLCWCAAPFISSCAADTSAWTFAALSTSCGAPQNAPLHCVPLLRHALSDQWPLWAACVAGQLCCASWMQSMLCLH